MQDLWSAVDGYIIEHLIPADAALDSALRDSAAAGLPAISVSPPYGMMLMLLARIVGARKVLEVGTLGGYSTIWLGRGLAPGGRIVTLESHARHAEVARSNLARAGLQTVAEVRLGAALDTLPKIAAAGEGPFDMVFIDADKPNNPAYFDWAVRLSRPGALILVDNVVRDGEIIDAKSSDPRVTGTRRLYEALSSDPRVSATVIQTVGGKGHDGFVMAVVS